MIFSACAVSTQSSIGSFNSVRKSSLPRRINEPSISIVTVALRLAAKLRHLVRPRLVPREHYIEQVAVDREVFDGARRHRRVLAGQLRRQRIASLVRPADDFRYRSLALA